MNISQLSIKSLLVPAALLALPAAALAQQPAPLGGPEGSAAVPANPAPTDPAAPTSSTPAAPAAPAAPPNPQVVAFVDQQFPTADANKDGTITADEFSAWVKGLKTAELQKAGQPADPNTVAAYASGALAAADKDKDGTLTKTELVRFFGG